MAKKKYWSVSKAIEEAAKIGITVSAPTIYKWIDSYDIGHQPGGKGGKRYVDPDKFIKFITGRPFYEKNQDKDAISKCPNEK